MAQRLAHAALGPEGRVRTAVCMSEAEREIRLDGLRVEFPDASESEIRRRFIEEAHGASLPPPGSGPG